MKPTSAPSSPKHCCRPRAQTPSPFAIYWLRDLAVKAEAAQACRAQRGAVSASTLLVFVAGARFALATLSRFHEHLQSDSTRSEKSRTYHLQQLNKFRKFARIAPLCIWSPLHWLLTAILPSLTLVRSDRAPSATGRRAALSSPRRPRCWRHPREASIAAQWKASTPANCRKSLTSNAATSFPSSSR